jgi:hypothetical protein
MTLSPAGATEMDGSVLSGVLSPAKAGSAFYDALTLGLRPGLHSAAIFDGSLS